MHTFINQMSMSVLIVMEAVNTIVLILLEVTTALAEMVMFR